MAETATRTASRLKSVRPARRRAGIPKKRTRAKAAPPLARKNLGGLRADVVAAVVPMVRDAVAAVVPTMVRGEGMAQVGGAPAPAGSAATAQVRATGPKNPPEGVTVTVAVLPVVAPAWRVRLPLLERAMAGGRGLLPVVGVLSRVMVVEDPA